MRVVLSLAIKRLFFLFYGSFLSRVSIILHIDKVIDVLILDEDVLTSTITVVAVRDGRVFHLGCLFVGFFFGFLNFELERYQLLFPIFFGQTRLLIKHPLPLFQLLGCEFSLEASTVQNVHDPLLFGFVRDCKLFCVATKPVSVEVNLLNWSLIDLNFISSWDDSHLLLVIRVDSHINDLLCETYGLSCALRA